MASAAAPRLAAGQHRRGQLPAEVTGFVGRNAEIARLCALLGNARLVTIAALVASGLSNREIATKLVISKRTVDAHVEHIFGKLGLSSRVQLTVWLRDQFPMPGHRPTDNPSHSEK